MNTAENLSSDSNNKSKFSTSNKSKNKSKKKRGMGCRMFLYLSILLLSCLFVCLLVISIGWATGHTQDILCSAVTEDSPIADEIDCEVDSGGQVDDPDSDFPTVIDDEPLDTSGGNIDVAAVFEVANPSVVGIGVRDDEVTGDQVIGSGFVISENGLVATNQHVVSVNNADYFVKFEGSEELVSVQEIYRDASNDIAILRVDKDNLPALTLGNSDNLQPGQPVVAIGNPLGELSSTVTSGIISGLNREVEVGNSFLRTDADEFEDTIQTDAAINPGNSGGPLLDANGRVIGINFATIQGFDNLSFAIPVNALRSRVDELREFGRFRIPYLGVEYRSRLVAVGDEVFVGAQVLRIDPNSNAADALEPGDVVIQYNDTPLEERSLYRQIQDTEIGETVELVVIRDGERQTVDVEISERE
jgi:S1-C subfamily serine protease